MRMKLVELTVPPQGAGQRVDRWLAKARIGLSRNRLQALLEAERVLVNGKPARQSLKLKEGDAVRVEVPPRRPTKLIAEDAPLAIRHEDEHVIVLNKPAGVVVHPGAGVSTGTLVHALLHHSPQMAGVGGEGRPGIVHRLDKDTSGLMVVAKTEVAYQALVEALRVRKVRRVYQTIVWGDPGPDEGYMDMPIGRDTKERKRMAVVRNGGKTALTRWTVLQRFGLASFVEARLETGRTHQIRVHFAAVKHPVVGDPLYGGRVRKSLSLRQAERSLIVALLRTLRRQALHAAELEFVHPVSGERLHFESALPEDMAHALTLLQAFIADRNP
ncbi:MAG: RluA family pseudouridine synthase [Candidatus Eisenbacteria bacterium]|jgi:23S rRNA pseudouridine1911/1915/1917 synthase|nr:RluA family pseudouridine synthase [Candidatus Eisenbacteria bacterium]